VAEVEGYRAIVAANSESVRAKVDNQRQALLSYQARVQAEIGNAQIQNEYYKAVSAVVIENSRLQMTAQTQTAESVRAFGQSMATLGTANANIFAGLGQGALSGMNTLASSTLSSSL
jgi:hypothetical protein